MWDGRAVAAGRHGGIIPSFFIIPAKNFIANDLAPPVAWKWWSPPI